MKTFLIVLLCVFAAVQGRSTSVQVANNQRSLAAPGENPWVVHLRLAVSTSGLLQTSAGSHIHASWVLTSAAGIDDARFIWVRYGTVNVINPELVVETSAVRLHQAWNQVSGANNIALVSVNRVVESTQNIAVIPLPAAGAQPAASASLCIYGQNDDNTPGDSLTCSDVEILGINELTLLADASVSRFDTGAALVSEGVQIGIVSQAGDSDDTAVFTRTDAYIDWISTQTGVQFGRAGAPEAVIFEEA